MSNVVVHGHAGRPVLVFPSQGRDRHEWEQEGMLAAVGDLVEAGRVRFFCVDSEADVDRVAEQIGPGEIVTAGVSLGALFAARLTLAHPRRFPLALCFSGVYDFEQARALDGSPASLLLVAGRGRWEDTTGALEQTLGFAELLRARGIRHELDVWGEEAAHDWPAWRAQLAKHLPRFV